MPTKIIDISSYQKGVDFAKVKASGITGVILRAGYTGYGANHTKCKDDQFETHYKGAKAAGLNVGAYYYSGAMSQAFAIDEAKYFLALIKGKQFDLPVYMDVEETHSPTNMTSLGKTKLTSIVSTWCETVEKAGYFVGFYAAKSWCNTYLDMNALSRYTFWLAHWTSKTDYKGAYAMWQYSASGSVPGISGRVDMDYCYKDFPSIIKAAGLNGYQKQEPEKMYTLTISPLTKTNVDRITKVLADMGFSCTVTEVK